MTFTQPLRPKFRMRHLKGAIHYNGFHHVDPAPRLGKLDARLKTLEFPPQAS
jgi:hypothetical protein